jgi:hypothetical protein
MDVCIKQVRGICADLFSINFLHVTFYECKFCNRAEPCIFFHQPNVERRCDLTRSTVRHVCLLFTVNAYLWCLLWNLFCAVILSGFIKFRPWSRFLWIVLRFCSVQSESAEESLSEGTKSLLKKVYVHRDPIGSHPFLTVLFYSVTLEYITVVFQISILNHLMLHSVHGRETVVI